MIRTLLTVSACAALLASVAVVAPAQAAGARYEMATLPGTPTVNGAIFRVNVATGETVVAWGAATVFTPVVDSAPAPAGEYHIELSYWVAPDGKVAWNVYRLDGATGRSWNGVGGGDRPITWVEIKAPK